MWTIVTWLLQEEWIVDNKSGREVRTWHRMMDSETGELFTQTHTHIYAHIQVYIYGHMCNFIHIKKNFMNFINSILKNITIHWSFPQSSLLFCFISFNFGNNITICFIVINNASLTITIEMWTIERPLNHKNIDKKYKQ